MSVMLRRTPPTRALPLLGILIWQGIPVLAATFTVTKQTDDNGACEVDDCALREAVLAANASPGHDVILVPGGTYPLTLTGPVEEGTIPSRVISTSGTTSTFSATQAKES